MCYAAVSSAQLQFERMYHVYTVAKHIEKCKHTADKACLLVSYQPPN